MKALSFRVFFLFIPLFAFLFTVQVFADRTVAQRGSFSVSGGAETAFYSISGAAFGASAALTYGRRAAVGLKAAYFSDFEELINILELNILIRLFFSRSDHRSYRGLFVSFSGGPALFFRHGGSVSVPAEWGKVSAGVSLGWRFLFGRTFFVEPSIRGGYPYIFGAGLSAGLSF